MDPRKRGRVDGVHADLGKGVEIGHDRGPVVEQLRGIVSERFRVAPVGVARGDETERGKALPVEFTKAVEVTMAHPPAPDDGQPDRTH